MQSTSWSKVFRNIWRVNAVAIFLLVTISVVGLSATLLSGLFRSSHRNQAVSPDLAPQEPGKPELRLGQFARIGSSNVIRAELRQLGEGSFSIKGSRSISHNVLFVDTTEGKSWWLLPNSNSTIAEEHEMSVTRSGIEISLGKVYLIDAGGTENEKQSSLVLADPKGIKQVVVAKGGILVDELITFSAEEARLLYHDQAGYHLALINPSETKLVNDNKLPITFPPRN